MAIKKWAFVYVSPGFDPKTHTSRVKSPECEFISVGMDPANIVQAVEIAKNLELEGAQFIEFCAAFGSDELSAIGSAVRVPVGAVGYSGKYFGDMVKILT